MSRARHDVEKNNLQARTISCNAARVMSYDCVLLLLYRDNVFDCMNGNFRSPELVKRYKYTYYDLKTPLNSNFGNNNRQVTDNYRFTVDNSSEANPVDWYNAFLEVEFKLVTLAGSATGITARTNNGNQDCTTTNGQTFSRELQLECNGITVYNNTLTNETSNVLSLLNYTKNVLQILLEKINFSI